MYQALYRKYRPKTLEDVYGQDVIIRILKNSIKNKSINHAYIFSGPRGTGKTSVAKIFARIVNCNNLEEYKPCGKCECCKIQNNSDIIEIDAASNNGVDEIREIKSKVNLVPSYGKYKIYIVDEVHMLTVGAFNALLKTLEEPPNHVIFILATTDPQKIPETIISRCQRLEFKKISDKFIVENLKKISQKEKIKVEDETLYEIARLSDGGMRDSVGLLDQAKIYSSDVIKIKDIHDINGTITDEDLKILFESVIDNNLENIMKLIDDFNNNGKNFSKILEEYLYYLRNILLLKKTPKYFENTNTNVRYYESLSDKINENDIFNYIELLTEQMKQMKNTSNQKMIFELCFIQMININNSRLKEIEEKIQAHSTKKINNIDKIENDDNKKENKNTEKMQKSEKLEEFIKELKKIRIDNTLSQFNKKKLLDVKSTLKENLSDLLMNSDYSHTASILLDGQLKAASNEYLIFVYKTERVAFIFNENLIDLENTVEKALNKKYNLIATDIDEWEIIKDYFNNKKRKFIYKKEKTDIKKMLDKKSGDIISMFEDIIEYN